MKKQTQSIIPFFTFKGQAEEAMNYYVSIFPNSKIISLAYFEKGQQGKEGTVLNGTFELQGITIMVMDMEEEFCPDFTWATSMLLNCNKEEEFDHLFTALSKDGVVMMGPEAIMELRKVAWVTDKYGMTWQMVWE